MYSDKLSGSQIINVKAILELAKATPVEFGDFLEVSLDCRTCLAVRRTVQISKNEEYGICTPTRHQFTVQVISKNVDFRGNLAEVNYQIEYWYSPFFDRKRKQESQVFPTWGRLYFTITCFTCLKKTETSLQTNIVRPWTRFCECGNPLYTETKVMPIFEKI